MSRTEKPSFFDYFHAFLEKMPPAGPFPGGKEKTFPGSRPRYGAPAGALLSYRACPPPFTDNKPFRLPEQFLLKIFA